MQINSTLLKKISKGAPNQANMTSFIVSLDLYGPKLGLDQPHRLAHYIPQVMHESGSFKYDKEIWGPTAAQERYERRKDLGNTRKGDGKKFMGRTAMQLTGRGNYERFYNWCVKMGFSPPDFLDNPELVNTDPWEGLVPLWYWSVGNPTGKSLNRYADQNNPEMITKRINGGLNGYADRLEYYDRTALVLLGYGPTDLEAFQKAAKKAGDYVGEIDGDSGPQTRTALHKMLVRFTKPAERSESVQVAPVVNVTETKVAVDKPVPVVVEELEKPWYKSMDGIQQTALGPIGTGVVGYLTDIPTEKILVLVGLATVGLAAWYFIRRMNQKKQEKQVTEIKAEARVVNAEVKAANASGVI